MRRVAVVQRRIPQFRVPLFERLSREKNIDLTVFHSMDQSEFHFKTMQYCVKELKFKSLQVNFCNGLLRQLIKGKYEVIILEGSVHNLPFLIYVPLLRMLGKKVCWWSIGFEPYHVNKIHRIIRDTLYRIGSGLSDRIIAYHEKSKNYYLRLGNRSSKINIAWNVFDDEVLLSVEEKIKTSELDIITEKFHLHNKYVMLYVGKIEEAKRLGILIKAFEKLTYKKAANKYMLLIIGDGVDRMKWECYVHERHIGNIVFMGAINNLNELVKYFKLSHIFVMPGTGGMAIYQAMVYGLPVVVSDPDGVDHNLVVNNETGFYFLFDDPDDLAGTLDVLLQKGDVYLKKIGVQARQKAHGEFPMSRMVDNFYDAIMY